jgi:hypothetical protein
VCVCVCVALCVWRAWGALLTLTQYSVTLLVI